MNELCSVNRSERIGECNTPSIRINESLSNEIGMLDDMHAMLDEILTIITGPSNPSECKHANVTCMFEAVVDICRKTSEALNKLNRIRNSL